MTLMRRDPILCSPSSIHRYARRILRQYESASQTRCLSQASPRRAQHDDEHHSKRPAGMSNLEWMQLQHYKRWRRRLRDDPYQALFGASNDMLNGRGFKDWDWVYKNFPKWMLRDMEAEMPKQTSSPEKPPGYVGNVESSDTTRSASGDVRFSEPRKPHFPLPTFRAPRFREEDPSGVISPSDMRRPKEGLHANISSKIMNDPRQELETASHRSIGTETTASREDFIANKDHMTQAHAEYDTEPDNRKAAARESSFIDEFFAKDQDEESGLRKSANRDSWRQTVLQRRSPTKMMSNYQSNSPLNLTKHSNSTPTSSPVINAPPTGASEITTENEIIGATKRLRDDVLQRETPVTANIVESTYSPAGVRSPSQILEKLPKDDIDFLSAAEIRASMGAKRSRVPTDEERCIERRKLENTFATTAEKDQELDSMIESKIINDQLVRRTERKMREAEHAEVVKETRPVEARSMKAAVEQEPAVNAPAESSIDRMKRWLETTGANFAKQFWQEPTEEEDVVKTRLFFDKITQYVRKGRVAMSPVVEDLQKDIPASIPLLKRLKSDEEMLELAILRLRQRSSSGSSQGLSPRMIKAMDAIKSRYHQTNTELEKAYTVLRELATTEAAAKATGSFKRRLGMASRVLHKNAQLSRMLIWSLQTRLEDPNMDRKVLPNYKLVADNLLSLRDTQMTLMRLVDRAMLVYGVTPQAMDAANAKAINIEGLSVDHEEADFANCDEPSVRARLAADAHLINEIKAHRSAMQGRSDDGYSRDMKTKTTSRASLDDPKPLAHSLFRPFGPAFEKLGREETPDPTVEKAKEKEKRRLEDIKLVEEVKKAYEETYGTITVDHRQVALETNESEIQDKDATLFTMLKEDPVKDDSLQATEIVAGGEESRTEESASISEQTKTVGPPVEVSATTASETTTSAKNSESDTSAVVSEATIDSSKLPSSSTATSYASEENVESSDNTASPVSTADLPTHYTILIYDPKTDKLSITTSTAGPPRDTAPTLPLHQALSSLDNPAKFIPHIVEGLEIITAKKDILILRDSIDKTSSIHPFETVTPSTPAANEDMHTEKRTVNPIDGTAHLSPTGYVPPEESADQLEKEFNERRHAAGRFSSIRSGSAKQKSREGRSEKRGAERKERKRGVGSVVKTAIWVAGLCYIVGVFGEIATSPYKG